MARSLDSISWLSATGKTITLPRSDPNKLNVLMTDEDGNLRWET